MRAISRTKRLLGTLAMAALAIAPLAAAGQTQVKPGMNFFSIEQDIKLGRSAADQVDRQMPMVNDPVVQEWIDQLGHRLASNTTMPNLPWRFRVVNSGQVNAFALPGGFVYVNRALVQMTDNEAEVAGAMAHEMAHVTLRHGTNQLSKALLIQSPFAVLGGFGGGMGALGQLGGAGMGMAFLKFSRDAERNADIVGTQTMCRAGYDPRGMVTIFQKLERTGSGSGRAEFFSDHPSPENRVQRVQQEITKLRVPASPLEPSQLYYDARERLRDMAPAPRMSPRDGRYGGGSPGRSPGNYPGNSPGNYPGDSRGNYPGDSPGNYPRNPPGNYPGDSSGNYPGNSPGNYPGNSRGNYPGNSPGNYPSRTSSRSGEPPSRELQTFRSQDGLFQVGYPSNWEADSQTPTSVTLAPGWANEGQELTHGAIVSYFEPQGQSRGRISLGEATDMIVSKLAESGSYLKENSGSRYNTRVSGAEGIETFLTGRNSLGVEERDWLVVRNSGQGIIYMLFIAPTRDYGKYEPTFKSMLRSFHVEDGNRNSSE
jgi:Zn-dependent protease with chaperone function